MGAGPPLRAVGLVGAAAGGQHPADHPHGVQVGGGPGAGAAAEALRGQVAEGAPQGSGAGGVGDAEVREDPTLHLVAAGETEDVAGLEVTVHHAAGVEVGQPGEDVVEDLEERHVLVGQRPRGPLEHQVGGPGREPVEPLGHVAGVEELDQVGVAQGGVGAQLVVQAAAGGPDHLDGDGLSTGVDRAPHDAARTPPRGSHEAVGAERGGMGGHAKGSHSTSRRASRSGGTPCAGPPAGSRWRGRPQLRERRPPRGSGSPRPRRG